MSEQFSHIPVLLDECIESLNIKSDGNYLDATMGGGGHSLEIAKRLKGGTLYCFDKDPDAIAAASDRLSGFDRVKIIESDFSQAAMTLSGVKLDGALFDLGVSSYQLDTAERGFSYHTEAPLDMRMSKSGLTAETVVNTYELSRLTEILRAYGESPFAYEIAKKIVSARQNEPITTTTQLADICLSSVPARERRKDKHPAKTVFQAIRMEVNDELDAIRRGLSGSFSLLNPGGRLCVISFHSVEDRVVKQEMIELIGGCTCPPDFPVCVCGKIPQGKLIGKKPVTAGEEELLRNRRSHSAKLRVLEKI